jgi:hypothetical protein
MWQFVVFKMALLVTKMSVGNVPVANKVFEKFTGQRLLLRVFCADAFSTSSKLETISLTTSNALLYPFGLGAGDNSGPFSDCNNGFSIPFLTLEAGLPYFGDKIYHIYVSMLTLNV